MSTRGPSFLSDLERNARKYENLLRALRHTNEIAHEIERAAQFTIVDILTRLLPHYVTAIEAQRGFVARRAAKAQRGRAFDVIAVEPATQAAYTVMTSARLEKMVGDGGARILSTHERAGVIPELRGFEARSAVLASFRALDYVYLVGLLDKVEADKYPFLAADRRVLENLLSLLALGLRSVERRQRELQIIQEISERIVDSGSRTSGDDTWQMIARNIADVSSAQIVGIYAYNADREQLEPRCIWDSAQMAVIGAGAPLARTSASLNGAVACALRPRYLPDVEASPDVFLATAAETGVRAAYCAPLVSRQELVGTLYVASVQPDSLARDQRDAVDRLAPHVAIALHNALLLDRDRRALQIDEDVIKIQQAIADVLQEEKQAEQIRDVLMRFFPAQSDFFVAGYNADTGEIRLRIVYEHGELVQDLKNHPRYRPRHGGERRGLFDYMLRRGASLLDVPDFAAWQDVQEIEDDFKADVQCCLIKTLEHEGQLTGWVGFRSYTQPASFNERHRILLEKTAPHIAIVQRNAQLYDQRIHEREVVSEFQTAITRLSQTEKEEIEEVSGEVRKALRSLGLYTGDFYIALYDEQRQQLRVPVCYERGERVSVETRNAHPVYRSRTLEKRNGLVEWILRNDQPVLARTRREVEAWRAKGVTDLPEAACCWLGVPMRMRNRPMGVMALRSSTAEHVFTEAHIPLFLTIANQAAITIDNARLFQQLDKQHVGLLRAGQAIAAASNELEDVLNIILEQAVRMTDSHLGVMYGIEGESLVLRAVWPGRETERMRGFYNQIPLTTPGVMARAVRERQAQLIADVSETNEYLDISNGVTRSELAVVLIRGAARTGDVLGVLNVEHREVGGLDDTHRRQLISLSNLAVAALQSAERAVERRRLHTIAVMGVFGADVIHDVKQEISAIRWAVDRLRERRDLDAAALSDLDEIDEAAARMRVPDLSMTERSLGAAGASPALTWVDSTVADEVALFRKRTSINAELDLGCNDIQARIHEEWLRRLIRHYLKNAQKHLSSKRRPHIVVRTRVDDAMVTVYVEDNGRGVRENIRPQLFGWEIAHEDGPPGRGLLLVSLVAEAHGGRAWLADSKVGHGACFAFSLPVALTVTLTVTPTEEESTT
jgi:GAF domain-containing protein